MRPAPWLTGAGDRRGTVPVALGFADNTPAAAGDVAELGDVDVEQRAGMVVLVASHGFPGHSVDEGEPIDPAAGQYRVHGRDRHTKPPGDLDGAESRRHRNRNRNRNRSASAAGSVSWSDCGVVCSGRSS